MINENINFTSGNTLIGSFFMYFITGLGKDYMGAAPKIK